MRLKSSGSSRAEQKKTLFLSSLKDMLASLQTIVSHTNYRNRYLRSRLHHLLARGPTKTKLSPNSQFEKRTGIRRVPRWRLKESTESKAAIEVLDHLEASHRGQLTTRRTKAPLAPFSELIWRTGMNEERELSWFEYLILWYERFLRLPILQIMKKKKTDSQSQLSFLLNLKKFCVCQYLKKSKEDG